MDLYVELMVRDMTHVSHTRMNNTHSHDIYMTFI